MKKHTFIAAILFVLAVISQLILSSCNKQSACDVENPLKDLPWLADMIDGFEKDAKEGYPVYANIYQCTYSDGIGFLLEPCVDCPDAGYSFLNCKGEVLCGGGGIDGKDTCSEYKIKKKKWIWESK